MDRQQVEVGEALRASEPQVIAEIGELECRVAYGLRCELRPAVRMGSDV
ncbi:hypothetical protein ACFC18_19225 [Streptomyces sp. NPDC056121]|nr:hypothetical protein [Streptomyces sp. NBC_00401]MCX5084050.1 hypothetical protein [Streptomyces sp. NBC_00401]